jgi:tRNA wybutosine-synthesizing protein 1
MVAFGARCALASPLRVTASAQQLDRPLFGDFWERFLACLDALRARRQRTVYRLTLVKGWNMEDEAGAGGACEGGAVGEYAALLARGRPDLVEIKSMTYCGASDASSLTVRNVPWHAEVRAFAARLAAATADATAAEVCGDGGDGGGGGDDDDLGRIEYGIAAEHEHSCCVLLARKDRFLRDGVWHTWIDYDK